MDSIMPHVHAAGLPAQLQKYFSAPLYAAAQRLIDDGGVSDVRVLQGGRVITGVADAAPIRDDEPPTKHRIYIQRPDRDELTIEGECDCGERSPCVHVAAVMLIATKTSSGPVADDRLGRLAPEPCTLPQNASGRSAPVQQRLSYLLEGCDIADALDSSRELQISVWVAQTGANADGRHIRPVAWRLAPRTPDGNRNYPRYVDAHDREILDALTAHHSEGPWTLSGAAGFVLLQRAVVTGRAFWQSLQGPALAAGAPRQVRFAWEAMPNGNQRLRCAMIASLDLLLGLEPPSYIDGTTGEWALLELPYPVELLRRYGNRTIAPEDVAALDADLSREVRAAAFPRPRALAVQGEALSSLRARLVLSAEPKATLHFVYNGVAVEDSALRAEQATVRHMNGDIVHEIRRDREAERRLRTQLDEVLAETPRTGEAWLGLMMNGVPALRAAGWDVTTDAGFPYRIAAAGDWYADMRRNQPHDAARPHGTNLPHEAHPPHGANRPRSASRAGEWFDLNLGVMVDGHPVNLLPALVHYLQSSMSPGSVGPRDESCLRIGDHVLVRLEATRYLPVPMERIQRIADTLVELFDQESLGKQQFLTLPVGQAARLAQLTLGPNAPVLQSDDPWLLAVVEAVKNFSGVQPLTAPAHFPATLRPYQQEGLGWLQFLRSAGLGGILADDMGLGKTVQALAHLAIEKQQGRLRKPSLIVAPVSVLGNWQQEIHRFTPDLTRVTLHGTKRKEMFSASETADVVLIGYPALLLDSEVLLARDFYFVILDEAQTIKNPRAKVSQVARALRADHRLCLTGTPMENHLGELWSLFDFVQPGLLGEQRQFQRQYRTPIENGGDMQRG
ncbi:MAG: SNF2-related protein, partial [Pseudomonadota bacterium]|nr:SNF2-related protein [Pseudomonadota bacterium]